MGVHPNPIVNEINSEVPLAKTATKPQTFKPLYPELRLTQEKTSNEKFQQFLKQTGTHKNVPIKNDRARHMPIPNAIPPVIQDQCKPHRVFFPVLFIKVDNISIYTMYTYGLF